MAKDRFKVALFEADEILYSTLAACTTDIEFSGNVHYVANVREFVRTVTDTIETMCSDVRAERAILAWSCPRDDNFRREIWPAYKAHRSALRPPGYFHARAYLALSFECLEIPHLEADDVVGIGPVGEGSFVRVSRDKDLLTVPGWLYDGEALRCVTEDEADEAFLFQTLIGDRADGYPGAPGCGEVTARKVLETSSTFLDKWSAVVDAFASKGLTEEDAIVQARLARILRPGEYDRETSTITLWAPTSETTSLVEPEPGSLPTLA